MIILSRLLLVVQIGLSRIDQPCPQFICISTMDCFVSVVTTVWHPEDIVMTNPPPTKKLKQTTIFEVLKKQSSLEGSSHSVQTVHHFEGG